MLIKGCTNFLDVFASMNIGWTSDVVSTVGEWCVKVLAGACGTQTRAISNLMRGVYNEVFRKFQTKKKSFKNHKYLMMG